MELLHAIKKCLAIGFEMINEGPIKYVGLAKMMWSAIFMSFVMLMLIATY